MTAEDIIKDAGILLKEDGWCQNYYCYDKANDKPVTAGFDIGLRKGYSHCIIGAMRQSAYSCPESGSYEAFTDAVAKIAKVIDPDVDEEFSAITRGIIIDWNDQPGRTQEEVLGLLRKAMGSV